MSPGIRLGLTSHQPRLSSAKHGEMADARPLVRRGTRHRAEPFSATACHAPRVAAVCFSVGRFINHEYLMIACSRSDGAAGVMENINAGEEKFE